LFLLKLFLFRLFLLRLFLLLLVEIAVCGRAGDVGRGFR
jgi:hypothetical protein